MDTPWGGTEVNGHRHRRPSLAEPVHHIRGRNWEGMQVAI
ncbi:hypothetical protein Sros_7177 [Streptosporangium roseum DSM 43021]|uniref:Uncharacterized protein n=1 Tax=Streptosporangium roseum (strain ATCC 12428 / DSM 43021 / JCM 3005 / KCTC 9067 / NCIMB 10171 / NRRL 2505 / NI 9100) TaxID=479432 RepID=D2BAP1_STRRD|nr:hypothetical protein Sros_7177 [Streptosporangium roseum DSM 43021]